MAYPDNIDVFSDKLNKKQDGSVYVVEEALAISGGVYDGFLAHDNVTNNTIRVYTGSLFTGVEITNFVVSIPSETLWKRNIRIYADVPTVYVTYETKGDSVEADDINALQGSVTNTQIEVQNKVDKVTGKQLSTEDYTTAEKTKLAGVEANANNYVHPANHPASIITQDANNRLVSDAEKATWSAKAQNGFTKALDTRFENLTPQQYQQRYISLTKVVEFKNNSIIGLSSVDPFSLLTTDALWTDSSGGKYYQSAFVTEGFYYRIGDLVANTWSVWYQVPTSIANDSKYASKAVVTTSANGLMIASDKTKLDGVEAGANNYVHPTNHLPSIITQDINNRFVTDAEKSTWNGKQNSLGYTPVNNAGDTMNGFLEFIATKGLVFNTGGVAKGRLHTLPSVPNWIGFTLNCSFNGSGWVLDDPTLVGWFFKMDSRSFIPEFSVYRIPTGAGTHTDEQALFTVKADGTGLLSGNAIYHSGNQASLTQAEKDAWNGKQNALGFTPENVANKGTPNGYAGLDASGKVPAAQLPESNGGIPAGGFTWNQLKGV